MQIQDLILFLNFSCLTVSCTLHHLTYEHAIEEDVEYLCPIYIHMHAYVLHNTIYYMCTLCLVFIADWGVDVWRSYLLPNHGEYSYPVWSVQLLPVAFYESPHLPKYVSSSFVFYFSKMFLLLSLASDLIRSLRNNSLLDTNCFKWTYKILLNLHFIFPASCLNWKQL